MPVNLKRKDISAFTLLVLDILKRDHFHLQYAVTGRTEQKRQDRNKGTYIPLMNCSLNYLPEVILSLPNISNITLKKKHILKPVKFCLQIKAVISDGRRIKSYSTTVKT